MPGDIIILHMCTINDNHMMNSSWDMEHDAQNFLSFWTIFCPLTLLTTWKIKILKIWKNTWRYYHFTHVYHKWQLYDVWFLNYGVRQTTFFCHFEAIFALLLPYKPRKSQFWKHENNAWRYYHFTHTYHEWQSYDVWFLYGFFILDQFLPSPSPPPLSLWINKIKILKTRK